MGIHLLCMSIVVDVGRDWDVDVHFYCMAVNANATQDEFGEPPPPTIGRDGALSLTKYGKQSQHHVCLNYLLHSAYGVLSTLSHHIILSA